VNGELIAMRDIAVGRSLEMRLFTRYLDDKGIPWYTDASRIGLPARRPGADAFLPSSLVTEFLGQLVEREDFAEMSALASLGPDGEIRRCTAPGKVEAALLNAPTLYSGLRALCHESASQWSHCRFWLRETERTLWVCSLLALPGGNGNRRGWEQQVQSRLIRLVGLIQDYLGSRWRPEVLLLETGALPSLMFAEIMQSPRVITGAAYSAVPVPRKILSEGGPLYRSAAGSLAPAASDHLDADWSCVHCLKLLLPEYVMEPGITIERIAEIAGVSSRTLQRALAAEGITYRELIDSARFQVARQKLTDPAASIDEISRLLGYSESTHFTRAFRRIAGRTPSEYRKDLLIRA